MAIMDCCCFLASLRTASYVTVAYTLIYFSISCVTVSTYLYEERSYLRVDLMDKPLADDNGFGKENMSTTTVIFNVLLLGCAAFGVVSSLLVVLGLRMDKRELLCPWMIVMLADTLLELGHFVYLVVFNKLTFVPITAILFTIEFFIMCLNIYCLLCVVSQYQEYKAGRGCVVPDETFSCTVEAVHYTSPAANNQPHPAPLSRLNVLKANKQKLVPICTTYIHQTDEKSKGGNLHLNPNQFDSIASKKRVQFPD